MADLNVITPVGKLMWVNVTGIGKLNYNKDGREFVATVILSSEDAKPLVSQIKEAYDANHQQDKKIKSTGYRLCDEDGEFYSFNFRTRTTFKDGKSKEIPIYYPSAQRVDIGNNSQGAIIGTMSYYTHDKDDGISLWLDAIKITKLEGAQEIMMHSSNGFQMSLKSTQKMLVLICRSEINYLISI